MNPTNARQPSSAPFDTWAVLDLLLLHWRRIVVWTLLIAVAGGLIARAVWSRAFSSTAQLIHYEASSIDDSYHPRALAAQSLVVMLQSPGLFEEVGSHLSPPVSAKQLSDELEITLDRNNDVVTVTATGRSRGEAVDIVNRFCAAAINYTQTIQRQEAVDAGDNVNRQLAQVESEIQSTYKVIPAESAAAVASVSIAPAAAPGIGDDLSQRILHARETLNDLLMRYTDAHPLVIEQRMRLASLEAEAKQAQASGAPSAGSPAPLQQPAVQSGEQRYTPEEVAMGERLRTLEANRELLIERQRAIQPFRDNPPGYFRVLQSATANPTQVLRYRLETVLFACLGAFLGFVGAAAQVLLAEFFSNRISTRADVRRVTGLPLVAVLGNLKSIPAAAQEQWALRTWLAVRGSLGAPGVRGAVCGITSAKAGDGRTTWVNLLARGASSCGCRVITVTPQAGQEPQGAQAPGSLSAPTQVVERLKSSGGPSVAGVSLPQGKWTVERREQLALALAAWRAVDNLVVLVELPPADTADCALLADTLPNVIWLVDGDRTDATVTIDELQALRDARCNLAGAVLNREAARPMGGKFSRWIGSRALVLLLGASLAAPHSRAADEAAPAQDAPSELAGAGPAQRAAWQQKLTLGPGDVLTFHLYGSPELTREGVPIGPDGRVSYLEAENVDASGLTVDELRARINEELGRYRRAPEAYITPVAYHSKRYYILGTVVQKGVYYLDRPTTVVEAVARARGFVTGVSHGDTIDATDFSHSFLVRGGQRVPVDFAGLFLHGDLSQNVTLEPNDYLYFPPSGSGEIFVLGEVGAPGPVGYDPDVSALSAIASRGGFTTKAWKGRVLVVRGSLDHPVAYKVDIEKALRGDAPNLALEPGDLVYVANRPWIRAEEMLDLAATAFAESAVVTWTGLNVGPNIISKPNSP
jgi:protein involved in polysaccharide export with SLBB domain/capsular polysaccharide biosynthesis protein